MLCSAIRGCKPRVVQRVTEYLSLKLNTKCKRIKAITVRSPKKIVLEGVFMEDQHQDTLLYAGEIKSGLKAVQCIKKTHDL